LSVGASLGIAVLARPIGSRLRGPGWLREILAVTLAAQLGVAPVLLPVFGSVPLVSLPANLVAVPLAAPLTVWGLASGVIGGLLRPLAPPAGAALCAPGTALVHALLAVADLAARVPVAIDGRAALGVVALVALTAAVRLGVKVRRDVRPVPAR
jgi:competence protein ComEC